MNNFQGRIAGQETQIYGGGYSMIFKNWQEAQDFLGNKDDRPAAPAMDGSPRNTRIQRRSNGIALKYSATDVVLFDEVGMILNADGWRTMTTKARMNCALPKNVTLWQEKGVWYLSVCEEGNIGWRAGTQYVYEDFCKISYDGKLLTELAPFSKDAEKEVAKKVRRINKYVHAYFDALEAGKVELPSSGDCWYCLMFGEQAGSGHLESHIEESYFVPSLLKSAMDEKGASTALQGWVYAKMSGEDNGWGRFNMRDQGVRLLRSYMKTHMEIAN